MRKTVGILDDTIEYGRRLAGAINTRTNTSLRATFIGNPSEVKDKLESKEIQLLLVSERYACYWEDTSIPVFTLVSEPVQGSASDPGGREIPRYSPLTDIIDMLLSEAYEAREKETEKLIVYFSPDSVELALSQAEKMADYLAKTGKTLFLPFDNFYGKDEKTSITDLLYAGLGGRRGLSEIICELHSDSCHAFSGPEHFSDLWQYSEDQMKELLAALLEQDYQHIVIGAGFISDAVYMLMKQCDVIYIPKLGGDRAKEFLRQAEAMGDGDISEKVRECL